MASKTINLGLPYDSGCCGAMPCCPPPGCDGEEKMHYPEVYIDFLDDPKLPDAAELTFKVKRLRYEEDDVTGKCSYRYRLLAIKNVTALEASSEEKPDSKDVLDKLMQEVVREMSKEDSYEEGE